MARDPGGSDRDDVHYAPHAPLPTPIAPSGLQRPAGLFRWAGTTRYYQSRERGIPHKGRGSLSFVSRVLRYYKTALVLPKNGTKRSEMRVLAIAVFFRKMRETGTFAAVRCRCQMALITSRSQVRILSPPLRRIPRCSNRRGILTFLVRLLVCNCRLAFDVVPQIPMRARSGLIKTGTGSATSCVVALAKPLLVAVPVPVFIKFLSAQARRG